MDEKRLQEEAQRMKCCCKKNSACKESISYLVLFPGAPTPRKVMCAPHFKKFEEDVKRYRGQSWPTRPYQAFKVSRKTLPEFLLVLDVMES